MTMNIEDYTYHLPAESIAQRPLANRDSSRLLWVRAGTLAVTHHVFTELPQLLQQVGGHRRLVLNQTKVVPARLFLKKSTGGVVEVFLNEPLAPSTDPQVCLASTSESVWSCLIGGRNVQAGMVLQDDHGELSAEVLTRNRMEATVRLHWSTGKALSDVLESLGHIPLPPYINRADDGLDKEQYQTVFAKHKGSVAAPTAGLHFTPQLLQSLNATDTPVSTLTLHVGMGTFKPVEVQDVREHHMHSERVEVSRALIDELLTTLAKQARSIIPVGTTSMRSLESMYWLGCELMSDTDVQVKDLHVGQFAALRPATTSITAVESLTALQSWMLARDVDVLKFSTQLMIAPGAHIGITDGLITNFHQPRSTLLLLIASLLGGGWRDVYETALEQGYRFLSYGDAMLITRTQLGDVPTT